MITVGSLFSGIGGLELGLERAGMQVVWQVEKDPFCRQVLAKHWPNVTRFEDVKDVGSGNLAPVDLICGGFPCQDVSNLGRQAGITDDNRSGLWHEYVRILRELRPRYVLVENVANLLANGMGVVLGGLAELGYDAEWSMLSACAFGAPHTRKRVFILAYTGSIRVGSDKPAQPFADHVRGRGHHGGRVSTYEQWQQWEVDRPRVLRAINGVPRQLDRNRSIGNAVVPQVAEFIGRQIVAAHTQAQVRVA